MVIEYYRKRSSGVAPRRANPYKTLSTGRVVGGPSRVKQGQSSRVTLPPSERGTRVAVLLGHSFVRRLVSTFLGGSHDPVQFADVTTDGSAEQLADDLKVGRRIGRVFAYASGVSRLVHCIGKAQDIRNKRSWYTVHQTCWQLSLRTPLNTK